MGLGMAFRLSARLGLCEAEDAARVGAHLEAWDWRARSGC
jgi:hypothetical protein